MPAHPRPGARRRRPSTPRQRRESSGTLDRLLTLRAVDGALGWLLARPRALAVAGALLGIALVALTFGPLLASSRAATAPGLTPIPALATAGPTLAPDADAQAAIALVATYNQASIAAAALGRVDGLAPYLASDRAAWAEVQAEYARRAARGETHDPALTRWGLLHAVVDGARATVETQEQWDDRTIVAGQIISSRRGMLTRNVYTLRRASETGGWLITDVTTEVVVA